ncbi:Hypothetical predicted protein [Octopus vulgaris]|uniref:Uncharacterized protein n=1 Tax=Octopus vulgaris TaxID=6645 RepID=A0AA36B942_OCTVU|nr:Hypothetical predicted protein [Octopus vulgaris]
MIRERAPELDCNHDEGDTRVVPHVLHMAHDSEEIIIRASDTDIAVIMLCHLEKVKATVWMEVGTSCQNTRWKCTEHRYQMGAVDKHDIKTFYEGLKVDYGLKTSSALRVLILDDTQLLMDKNYILSHWAEHFNRVLKQVSTANNDIIDDFPQCILDQLDWEPSLSEVIKDKATVLWEVISTAGVTNDSYYKSL